MRGDQVGRLHCRPNAAPKADQAHVLLLATRPTFPARGKVDAARLCTNVCDNRPLGGKAPPAATYF